MTNARQTLRQQAEERVKKQSPDPNAIGSEETGRLLHELQVHQIELEMQNEELRRAQEEVEVSRTKYFDLYDLAPVGYLTLNEKGLILEANLIVSQMLGVDRGALVKQPISRFILPEDQDIYYRHLKQLFETGKQQACELRILRAKADPFWVRIESTVGLDVDGVSINRTMISDIADRKRMEDERIIMSKLESTGILAGGIAHDFNNLLTAILGNLELIMMFPHLDGGMTAHLEAAQKAALMARDLTKLLITFSKGGEPIKKLITLSGLLEEQGRFTLRGSPVGCNFSLPSDLWLTKVDESQMGQVIRNIVLNAREAMPEGGLVSVMAENLVLNTPSDLPLPTGDYVKVSLTDQGGGIPAEILPKIFDPYFSTKQRGGQKGMGLGLTICHSVVQKHGGAITVDSKTGEGTAIQIYLPALRKGMKEEPAGPDIIKGPGRILVMDDAEIKRNLIRAMLTQLGYEVELVEDGKKAVECYRQAKAQEQPFDVVILDSTVQGGMGGVKTIRELVQIDPTVRAIVLSSYDNDPVIQNYEQYGFRGALLKPFLINDLSEVLSRIIGTDNIPKITP